MSNFNIEVNEIFFSSWGYDQTNINFYQVIKKTEKTILLREVEKEATAKKDDFMCGQCSPIENSFKNDKTFRVNFKNAVGDSLLNKNDCSSKSYLDRWDGKPKYFSFYA
jgi:hypothetical protein